MAKSPKKRLDQLLVDRSLATDLGKAQALVLAGEVRVAGQVVSKAGESVKADAEITLLEGRTYVSRAGDKLVGALSEFGLDVAELVCADVGAAAGGFTDVLISNAAAMVYAIDVGYGEFDWKLRNNPKVSLYERTNVRSLTRLPHEIDLAVADLSFISLRVVLPVMSGWLKPTGRILALVKPQFEAKREEVEAGGLVRSSAVHTRVLREVIAAGDGLGLSLAGVAPSSVRGTKGNQEFFVLLGGEPLESAADPVAQAIDRVHG